MNIKVKVSYFVYFYNRILTVVPLYDLSFSRTVLISHSHIFSFVSEEKKNYYFCSHISVDVFRSRRNKGEDNSLLYHVIVKY